MVNRNLYVLPVIENGKAFSYYCLVSLVDIDCRWMLMRNDEFLSHGVCGIDDVSLMLDSLRTDLYLSEEGRDWATATIH